jgi:hypothetical protein
MTKNIQSVLIPYSFSLEKAIKWLDKHGYVHYKVDYAKHYMRFRQFDPKSSHEYRMISLNSGIKLVRNINKMSGSGDWQIKNQRIQSVLLPNYMDAEYGYYWLTNHGFSVEHAIPLDHHIAFEQFKTDMARSYRRICLNDGIELILDISP